MTKEELDQLDTLYKQIANEDDPRKFTELVKVLNDLMQKATGISGRRTAVQSAATVKALQSVLHRSSDAAQQEHGASGRPIFAATRRIA
jgi:hypothetical protein